MTWQKLKALATTLNNCNDTTVKLLKQLCTIEMKRVRLTEQLSMIKVCLRDNICSNRITNTIRPLKLAKNQAKKLREIMLKNIRKEIHRELADNERGKITVRG